jgi:flagellar motility protein MotE (MotC chaperone)
MIRLLQSSWMTALTGAAIYLGVTAALIIRPGQFKYTPPAPAYSVEEIANYEPSWKFRNPEFEQWVAEMKRERESMMLREQQLQDLQARLEAERQELMVVTQTVYQLQTEFDRNVIRIKEQEAENVKKQAKVMATMSPEAAAGLITEMSEDDATRIVFTMKPDEASPIIEALSTSGRAGSRRAAIITERLRRTLPPDFKPRPNASK